MACQAGVGITAAVLPSPTSFIPFEAFRTPVGVACAASSAAVPFTALSTFGFVAFTVAFCAPACASPRAAGAGAGSWDCGSLGLCGRAAGRLLSRLTSATRTSFLPS